MTTFTDTQLLEQLSAVFELARAEGEVRVRRTDGTEFLIRPASRSPLDVGYITPRQPVTTADIIAAVRDGRDRG